MKKKTIFIDILIVIVICAIIGVLWFMSTQYNFKGVSHFLVVDIDSDQEKQLVGKLEDHDVYVEDLYLEETYFRNIIGKNISIKETIEKNLTSISEWKKYASNIVTEDNTEILKFENYEIAITDNECIIRPITN